MVRRIINHPLMRNNLLYSGSSYGFRIFNNLLLFSILARLFSEGEFGIISFLIMISKIIQTAVDYGHRINVVKEVSIDPGVVDKAYIQSKVNVKTIISTMIFLPVMGYGYLNGYWGGSFWTIFAIFLAGYLSAISNLHFAILQGVDKYSYETKSLAVLTVSTIVGVAIVYWYRSFSLFILLYALAYLLQLIYTSFVIKKEFGVGFADGVVFRPSMSTSLKEFVSSGPFAAIVISEIVISSYDSFFVERYYTLTDLGYFEAIKKVVVGLTVFCIILNIALMPAVTRWSADINKDNIKKILKVFSLSVGAGLVFFITYFVFNEEIISILLGDKYSALTTWDTHIGILVISAYLRIIPGIFIIGSERQSYRLYLIILFLALGVFIFYLMLDGHDVKEAVKLTAYMNLALSLAYILVFGLFLSKDYSLIKSQ